MRERIHQFLIIVIVYPYQLWTFLYQIYPLTWVQRHLYQILYFLFSQVDFLVFSFFRLHLNLYYKANRFQPYQFYSIIIYTLYVIMPAYSMGKQQKKASFVPENDVPGAGTYNSESHRQSQNKRGPTFVIGRSKRIKTDNLNIPGPNVYNLSHQSIFTNKKKGYYITGKIRERRKSQQPGPGSYSIPKLYSSKYYSFGIKTQTCVVQKVTPGPGDYEPEKARYSHAVSFQQSKRPSPQNNSLKQAPGPGKYNNQGLKESKNKFVFSKREKFFEELKEDKEKKIIPGPGAYSNLNINNIKKQVMAIRFGKTKREFIKEDFQKPGPATYSPKVSLHKRSPVATIGNSPKNIQNIVTNPSPTAYNITDFKTVRRKQPSVIFGKTQRTQKNNSQLKAGPGSYNVDYHDRGCAFSISGRNSAEKNHKSPGPTQYSPKYSKQFRKTEMAIIGKDKKFHESQQKIPGPGTYNYSENISKSKSFYFPKQQRKENKNSNPGPGAYEIKPIIGSQVPVQSSTK